MRTTAELAAADRRHLWHPFTQQQAWCEEDPPLVIDHAEGTNLYDTDGNAYIDGVSSLWCNVHGHRHPAIDAAVRSQLGRVAHSTMLGLSHEPAIELAERLAAIAPPGLDRVFYSDSGSTAVEVALKMAYQWWVQRGERGRTGFVCLENAYHGDTLGAVSVGGIETFHSLYRPLLFDTWQAPAGDADALEQLLAEHGESVAAVVLEPLVQGAAGMLMQPPGFLRRVRELCDEHGVLLICDEVATGFGRTGRMFACEHEGVSPDLLCVGKGITGGYLPLAATLASERIYDGLPRGPRAAPDVLPRPHVHRQPARVRGWDRDARAVRERADARVPAAEDRAADPDARAPGLGAAGRRRGPTARVHGRDRAELLGPLREAGPPGDAERTPARRDHPPARRRRRADAAARRSPRPTSRGWSRSPPRRSPRRRSVSCAPPPEGRRRAPAPRRRP